MAVATVSGVNEALSKRGLAGPGDREVGIHDDEEYLRSASSAPRLPLEAYHSLSSSDKKSRTSVSTSSFALPGRMTDLQVLAGQAMGSLPQSIAWSTLSKESRKTHEAWKMRTSESDFLKYEA